MKAQTAATDERGAINDLTIAAELCMTAVREALAAKTITAVEAQTFVYLALRKLETLLTDRKATAAHLSNIGGN